MKGKTKTLDAVKIMRAARDDFSRKTAGMDFEEQRRYIAGKLDHPFYKPRKKK